MSARQIGTLKFFDHARGFGFILPDSGERDAFLHSSVLNGSLLAQLDEGCRIEYELAPSPRDPKRVRAINVRIVEEEP
jgi:cold shock protein